MPIVDPLDSTHIGGIVDPLDSKPITKEAKKEFPTATETLKRAVGDIPAEMGKSALGSYDTIKEGLFTRKGNQGPIEGTLKTGKALAELPMAVPKFLLSGLRSLIGHPMAKGEHEVGRFIDYLAGTNRAAQDKPEEMYKKAAEDVDTALSATAAKRLPTGKLPTFIENKPKAMSEEDFFNAAKTARENSEKLALTLNDNTTKMLRESLKSRLEASDLRDYAGSSPQVFRYIRKELNKDRPLTTNDVEVLRRMLGRIKPVQESENYRGAQVAREGIDEFINGLAPNHIVGNPLTVKDELKLHRANYSIAKRLEDVREINEAAETSTLDKPHDWHKAVVREIKKRLKKPGELRGYSKDEREQLEQIAAGTFTGDIARFLSRLSLYHPLSGWIPALIGGSFNPVLGAASLAAGSGAEAIANKSTMRGLQKLSDMIQRRGQGLPPAQPVPKSGVIGAGISIPELQRQLGEQ